MDLRLSQVFLLGLVTFSAVCSPSTGAVFQLAATELAAVDPFGGYPDAYVNVLYAFGPADNYELIGKTSTVDDSQNPQWPETFNVSFVPGTSQRFRFVVFDVDVIGEEEMGKVEFFLAELENNAEGVLTKPLDVAGNGNLVIQRIDA